MDEIKSVVRCLVDAICFHPCSLAVRTGENTDCIDIKVDKSDMGKLLGKRGRNIMAIRQIVFAMATKQARKRVVVTVDE